MGSVSYFRNSLTLKDSTQNNCTFLVSDEMLNDDIRHVVTEGISVLVETMDRAEDELVVGNGPILTAHHLKNHSMWSQVLVLSWHMKVGMGSILTSPIHVVFRSTNTIIILLL